MGLFRLGRTGAGFFRLHRGSGRHAARPERPTGSAAVVPTQVPTLGYAPTLPPSAAPVPRARPPVLTPSPPVQVAAPESGVALVFEDGSGMMLDATDPRVRVFRAIAGQLTAP